MRRIWNSWTYYGTGDSARTEKNEGSHDPWATGQWTSLGDDSEESKGALESAYARSSRNAATDRIERALDLCDVRSERVARVKRAIESGTYRISARELAQRLIRNMRGDYN